MPSYPDGAVLAAPSSFTQAGFGAEKPVRGLYRTAPRIHTFLQDFFYKSYIFVVFSKQGQGRFSGYIPNSLQYKEL
jgi:hypothetical protein